MKTIAIGLIILGSISLLFLFNASAQEKLAPSEALKKVNADALFLDVRSAEEFATGHAEGAMNIPRDQIVSRVGELSKYEDKEIVLYCKSGHRAGLAQAELTKQGFKTTYNSGGLVDLQAAGAKVVR